MVDYSKWDKLELSDDSDVEVHPNVDKKSFIRWKQRDIHEKREQNRLRTEQLSVNLEVNEDLQRRLRKLIAAAKSGETFSNIGAGVALSQQGEQNNKPTKATSPDQPKYTDMIESLLMQVSQEATTSSEWAEKLEEHLKMIESAIKAEKSELEDLKIERSKYITSDDLRDGWNSTIIKASDSETPASKAPAVDVGASAAASSAAASSSASSSSIEVINPVPKPKKNEDGLEELLPQTKQFGEINKGDFGAALKHCMLFPYILTEGQKDALLMTSFDAQLSGNTKKAEQIVFNSLILQYCAMLGGKDNVQRFITRIADPKHPAGKAFYDDVDMTYNHIKSRCEHLKAESAKEQAEGMPEEGQELIQLHAVDPNTEIIIALPEEGSEGRKIYDTLKPQVKAAIEKRSLDAINQELARMELEEAEELVGLLGEAGVLLVEEKIYEQEEFAEKLAQAQSAELSAAEDAIKAEQKQEQEPESYSTIDELD